MIQMLAMNRRIGVHLHRAKFEAEKARSQMSDPFLAEQGRAGRNQLHPSRNRRPQRQPYRRGNEDKCAIQNALPERHSAVCDTIRNTDSPLLGVLIHNHAILTV